MKFILIFGPPAVGKMAVGKELSKLTDFRLFHNHMTIELLIPIFDYGTTIFRKLNSEFRMRIFQEAATSDLPGFIFTYVWDFNQETEREYTDKIKNIFESNNVEVFYVELEASLEERLRRNKTEDRILEKPSKKNMELSEKRLLEMEKKYKMNTDDDFYYSENYLKIDNTNLSAEETAEKVKTVFNLI